MKFYSEVTRKFYETEEACLMAEEEAKKAEAAAEAEQRRAAEERKARAEEVEKKRDAYLEARQAYNEAVANFCKDYGAYHCTIKDPKTFNGYLDGLFKLF